MNAAIAVVAVLPLAVVWLLALSDVLTRRDLTLPRRLALAAGLLVFVPFAVAYALARPPSSVRRGGADDGDPRSALVDALEATDGAPEPARARLLSDRLRGALPATGLPSR